MKAPEDRNTMKFEKANVVLEMAEGKRDDVAIAVKTGGTSASVVVPVKARHDMAEALELAAMALKVWNKART